jgi:3-oxoacyl-[acyl-carrier-protein] synthase-3
MAVEAAKKLFASGACDAASIDFILLCTQSPDYFVPTTACLIQQRLGIPATAGALDFNLGSSGFVYGLGLAKGLVETGQASRVLLLTAETYSKYLDPQDRSVRTIFGDGAAATLVSEVAEVDDCIGPFVYGTDGSGARNLMVEAGAARMPHAESAKASHLLMDGAEIFNFTSTAAPVSVRTLLERAGRQIEEIDLFVFHQANKQILEHLRKRLKIPAEKFCISIEHGNCASSSIPMALKHVSTQLKGGERLMLVGFGPGYSWAGTLARWMA